MENKHLVPIYRKKRYPMLNKLLKAYNELCERIN